MSQAVRPVLIRDFKVTLQSGLLADLDLRLMGVLLGLLALGLVMVGSASIAVADRAFHDPLHYFIRQSVAAFIGLSLAYLAMTIPLVVWQRLSLFLLILAMALLALVLVPGLGKEVNGGLRWLKLGPISLQASEPAKLCVIIYLAGYLVRHAEQVRNTFIGLVKPVLVMGVLAVLLLCEPDFGTTVVLSATMLGMLFLGGASMVRFSVWVVLAVVVLAFLVVLEPYRMQRIMSFMDPWEDPLKKGYQLTHALIAFGRGEWFGVGLGGSIEKLFYLPEAHTDFIFAMLGEELGLVGCVTVIVLFGYVVWRALDIGGRAERAGRPFGAHLAYGIGLLLGLQAFINMGVNMGVLPTKGLTLPLISYGSNSLIVTLVACGLLLRVDYETRMGKVEREEARKNA
jgi:cell division protein FtsW